MNALLIFCCIFQDFAGNKFENIYFATETRDFSERKNSYLFLLKWLNVFWLPTVLSQPRTAEKRTPSRDAPPPVADVIPSCVMSSSLKHASRRTTQIDDEHFHDSCKKASRYFSRIRAKTRGVTQWLTDGEDLPAPESRVAVAESSAPASLETSSSAEQNRSIHWLKYIIFRTKSHLLILFDQSRFRIRVEVRFLGRLLQELLRNLLMEKSKSRVLEGSYRKGANVAEQTKN